MTGLNGNSPLRAKDEAEAHHYGAISAVEQDTPRNGATTIPTGLEESLPHTMSFGVIHATVQGTPLLHAMPLPLRLHQKGKGKLKVIKASPVIDSGKARTFPLDNNPSKQHQPFTTNRRPPPHQPGGTITN